MSLGQELWFSELVAQAWLEPELFRRYRADAMTVLGEFGVTLAQGQQPPALPEDPACELTIEELSRPSTAHAQLCFCFSDELPLHPGHPAARTASRAVPQ
ncbi:TIGR04351 family putative TOMM peptide [Streptomyces sp. SID12488]|uniref:TIGR04351 family putative TOMM peptide n=1 Tax=Streptomyces sp. SID12488 TaxID=2706040 RepID=UPI0013DD76DB|nr:putative TOMM peptide [Streptomyces sp. SID12488]